uniref:Uncharacterized protein n=1 Tax=Tetraselmis sp. GSL018 TaxID=582737 RepID=A0A061RIW8_9CHLO|mmetsp:Transcript_23675/g.56528  ORF Transcript_23675/g.56528 Transcript_23675/m.56528 type:complete len:466 (+) Transcript_23675:255-1652(+)|eukprot:CAMPEP_0177583964 /NCGR_PEP_ID=MMETSP0419_2-20121207/3627_1 /TAXON_ID=582737 /ORGANISM="Tetraselmis sp., Strain GSL018" /LENGTH=465 /DNA_ID=CAMNT_0019073439 /DNA_START=221 /DNA_END=1618 /DNA_ORIENTATION=+
MDVRDVTEQYGGVDNDDPALRELQSERQSLSSESSGLSFLVHDNELHSKRPSLITCALEDLVLKPDDGEKFWELAFAPNESDRDKDVKETAQPLSSGPGGGNLSRADQGEWTAEGNMPTLDDSAMGSDGGEPAAQASSLGEAERDGWPQAKPCSSLEHPPEAPPASDAGASSSSEGSGGAEDEHPDGSSPGELRALCDVSAHAGYTYSRESREDLRAQSDALQLLVSQLTAALDQVDGDRWRVEEQAWGLPAAASPIASSAPLPEQLRLAPNMRWLGRLPHKIRLLNTKHESEQRDLRRQLEESRAALQQSLQVQARLRDRADALCSVSDCLRGSLDATEHELELFKRRASLSGSAHSHEAMEQLDAEIHAAERWRRGLKAAVEASAAALPDQLRGLECADAPHSHEMFEVIALRRENQELANALADLSIKFAEADRQHTEAKRELARAKFQLEEALRKSGQSSA